MFATRLLLSMSYLSAAASAHGYSDDRPVGWQAAPTHRGTYNIISDCSLTIIACTWTIQHLNIPSPKDGFWDRKLRSAKWMVITILFPELMLLHAGFELAMALKALRRMEKEKKKVKMPWWWYRRHSQTTQRGMDTEGQPDADGHNWTLTHCFFANMGGFYMYREAESRHDRILVTALQLAEYEGCQRPIIPKEAIKDKSKQDWFAKVVASLQILQIMLSLIVRGAQKLAFSQLETITLGYAVCGVLIYLEYLSKPQGVETGIDLSESLRQSGNLSFEKTYDSFSAILMNKREAYKAPSKATSDQSSRGASDRIPNDNVPISENRVAHIGIILLAIASGLFGALHAIAWNFEFPSTEEKILWQVATAVAAGIPVVGLATIPLAQWTISSGDAQFFMGNCLRLMREYCWHFPDEKKQIDDAYDALEKIFVNPATTTENARKLYADILDLKLSERMLRFLKRDETDSDEKQKFRRDFDRLVRLMGGKLDSKKLNNEARTNVFPRKNVLPSAINQGILYVTAILYCLSRLSLLAVAFSSLRKMPESVYVSTPWTVYIPSLGSTS